MLYKWFSEIALAFNKSRQNNRPMGLEERIQVLKLKNHTHTHTHTHTHRFLKLKSHTHTQTHKHTDTHTHTHTETHRHTDTRTHTHTPPEAQSFSATQHLSFSLLISLPPLLLATGMVLPQLLGFHSRDSTWWPGISQAESPVYKEVKQLSEGLPLLHGDASGAQ